MSLAAFAIKCVLIAMAVTGVLMFAVLVCGNVMATKVLKKHKEQP